MVFDKKAYQDIYQKKYREENKPKIKERAKNYYKNTKEERINYQHSKNGKKSLWKRRGVNMSNFEDFWKLYCETSNCDICDRILTSGNPRSETTKCLDHNHKTGNFRAILCHSCNVRRKD